ncbi:interleukin-8-like [Clarias gariepinus]|uniref:interleukin-8-like n=1 Tax=Clarias gariepinus TaxID=13013 RepID=UPI00234DF133|nr:interleukin-8-like [Clarias gariepinus]
MSRSVLLLLLGCWMCASFCTAFRMERSERCLCQKSYRIHPKNIFEWKLYPPSASCMAYEIVVTTTSGRKTCLLSASKAWKFIMSGQRGPI